MDAAHNLKSAKLSGEKSREKKLPPEKNYKYHVWEYVYIFFLKSLNVLPQVVQLLCCPSQIEKLMSFSIGKMEKHKVQWTPAEFWNMFHTKRKRRRKLPIRKPRYKIFDMSVEIQIRSRLFMLLLS